MFKLKSFIAVFCLMCCLHAQAQVQYWGVARGSIADPNDPFQFGVLFRVDSNALNENFVFAFDTLAHGSPLHLTLASNGLIYAIGSSNALYSFDPVTDSFSVAFDFTAAQLAWLEGADPTLRMCQGADNTLFHYGFSPVLTVPTAVELPIFSYPIDQDTIIQESAVPGYYNQPSWYRNQVNGSMFMLPDGRLLVAQVPVEGIGLVDTVLGTYTLAQNLIDPTLGYGVYGDWVEVGGLYYSVCSKGAIAYEGPEPFLEHGYGVIYSYDLFANLYSKLFEFTDLPNGYKPLNGLIRGIDGLLYGIARGGTDYGTNTTSGVLYSYNITSNAYQVRINFGAPPFLGLSIGAGFHRLLASTNGKLYGPVVSAGGSGNSGIFEYDPIADTLKLCSGLNAGYGNMSSSELIELCRKPNYKPRATTSFSVCAGAHFFYDLQNVNATMVVWRRNGIVVPAQSNQLLDFAAIGTADAGVWTCTMTNECGVTETQPITIIVNAGSFSTSAVSGDTLLCGLGDEAFLSGNSGGTWVGPPGSITGNASANSIAVAQPGRYYTWSTQACGLSYSNSILVAHLDSAKAPLLHVFGAPLPDVVICSQDSIQLTVFDPWHLTAAPPVWNDGATAPSKYVGAGNYSVSVTNVCGSDTSNTIAVTNVPTPAAPVITLFDVLGAGNDSLLCIGDSIMFTGPIGANYAVLLNGASVGAVSDFGNFATGTGGQYGVFSSGGCIGLTSDTITVTITVDSFPPQLAAVILPDVAQLTGCDNQNLNLSSLYSNAYWTTEFLGQPTYDSTALLLVDWTEDEYVLTNYNGCGNGPNDSILIVANQAPVVSYSETVDSICVSIPPFTLSMGIPAGGTYTGVGVSGMTFSPALAGAGTHVLTYSWFDGICTGQVQDSLVVDACLGLAPLQPAEWTGVRISPNPNNGRFTLIIDRAFKEGTAVLFDAHGKPVSESLRLVIGANECGAVPLATGVYTLRIILDGMAMERSVVVLQ